MEIALLTFAILSSANAVASEEAAENPWRVFALRLALYVAVAALVLSVAPTAHLSFAQGATFAAVVVAAIAIIEADYRWLVIPDVSTVVVLAAAFLTNAAHPLSPLYGLALAGGLFLVVRLGFFWLRGVEGLGWGDVKFAAAMGALLGPTLVLGAIAGATGLSAAVLVLQMRRGKDVLRVGTSPAAPLGVGLAAATIAALCLQNWVFT